MINEIRHRKAVLSDILECWKSDRPCSRTHDGIPDDVDVTSAIEDLIEEVVARAIASYDDSLKKGSK